jgi:hypothetical protein
VKKRGGKERGGEDVYLSLAGSERFACWVSLRHGVGFAGRAAACGTVARRDFALEDLQPG